MSGALLVLLLQDPSMEVLIERFRDKQIETRDAASQEILRRWKDWKDADLKALADVVVEKGWKFTSRALLNLVTEFPLPPYAGLAATLLTDAEPQTRWQSAAVLGTMRAREHSAAVAKLLVDPHPLVRNSAVNALGRMDARDQADAVADLLKDPERSVRKEAVDALARLRARKYSGAIASRLKDPDLRSSALWALRSLRARDQADRVVPLLGDLDPSVRRDAACTLGWIGARDRRGDIAVLLRDLDPVVRGDAVEILGWLDAREFAPAISGLLKDDDEEVRCKAIKALVELEARDQVPAIAALLKDDKARLWAVIALGRLGAKEYAADLVALLRDKDLRSHAAESLVLLEADPKPIAALLKDPDPWTRVEAARLLGRLRAKDHARDLLPLLKDEYHPRRAAVWALGEMGAKGHVRDLMPLLKDPSDQTEVWVLARFGGKEIAKEFAALVKDPDVEVRRKAIMALGLMRAREYAADLIPLFKDPKLWTTAVEAVANMGAREHAADVARFLDEPNPIDAIHALGLLGAKKYAPKVASLLKSENVYLRFDAARALGWMGARDQAPAIAELLRINHELARPGLAAEALARLDAPELADALDDPDEYVRAFAVPADPRRLLKDPDGSIRFRAVRALGETGTKEDLPAVLDLLDDDHDSAAGEAACSAARIAMRFLTQREKSDLVDELRRRLYDPRRLTRIGVASALLRLGALDLAAQRRWLREAEPVFLEALSSVHKKDAYDRLQREVKLERAIESESDVREFVKSHGLTLEGEFVLRGRFPEGIRMTAARLLSEIGGVVVLEADRVRLVTNEEALRFWRKRLER